MRLGRDGLPPPIAHCSISVAHSRADLCGTAGTAGAPSLARARPRSPPLALLCIVPSRSAYRPEEFDAIAPPLDPGSHAPCRPFQGAGASACGVARRRCCCCCCAEPCCTASLPPPPRRPYIERLDTRIMAIPSYNDMRLPILRMLEDGEVHWIRDVIEAVAAELDVAGADRARLTPTTRRSLFDISVTRCVTDLRKAALLENTELGRFRITGDGRAILSKNPGKIDLEFLRENSAPFREWEESVRRARSLWKGKDGGAAGKKDGGAAGTEDGGGGMVAVIGVPGAGGPWGGGAGGPANEKGRSLLEYARDLLKEEKALKGLNTMSFSGTLFATARGSDHRDLLLSFGRAVWPAIVQGIQEDVPVRGCVACGSFARDAQGSVSGPAADEAAAYHPLPQWVGVSAAPSANAVLSGLAPGRPLHGLGGEPYAMHSIPLGTSVEQGAWAVNWPRLCDESGSGEIEEIPGIIEGRMDAAPDMETMLMWRSTRRFCDSVLGADA